MAKQFHWNLSEQGLILSSFFYGYIITQILGGILADKYGGKSILIFAGLSWTIFTLITPLFSSWGVGGLCLIRILLGLGEGVSFPASHSIISKWALKNQRSTAVSILTSFSYAGSPLAALIAAPLATEENWKWIFYCFGIMSLVWTLIWFYFGKSQPESRIYEDYQSLESNEETVTINKSVFHLFYQDIISAPWIKIFTSKEVWAILTNQFCSSWSFYILINWLPTYFQQTFQKEITELGVYSALPYAAQGILGICAGFYSDYLQKSKNIPVSKLRLWFQIIGMLGPSIFMILTIYQDKNINMALLMLTLTMGLSGLTLASLSTNQHDIAPNHAGLIFALGNTFATLPGQLAVYLTGWMLENNYGWGSIFGLAAFIRSLGAIFWFFLAGGDKVVIY
ncbi:MFS general substrate transporter [Neoconidiobolus thromboides FSU 785]|nr:MFS general substrate transporter [Neoconidiobolus thromboides FSU 785]